MGDAATQFYKKLANLLSAKHSLSYGIVMGLLRCKLSFSLLRSAIMCIRGARSSLRCPVAEAPIAVQVAEVICDRICEKVPFPHILHVSKQNDVTLDSLH